VWFSALDPLPSVPASLPATRSEAELPDSSPRRGGTMPERTSLDRLLLVWGKSSGKHGFHPLLWHMLDTTAVCEALLPRFSPPPLLPDWLVYIAALHDIGKADRPTVSVLAGLISVADSIGSSEHFCVAGAMSAAGRVSSCRARAGEPGFPGARTDEPV